jgi:hypothetical protein
LLRVTSAENLELTTIDVKSFLYSPINDAIYLRSPPGLSSTIMPPTVKLNECYCGLKQAAHE